MWCPHATASYKDVFDKSSTDICVLNEGEVIFYEIAKKINNIQKRKNGIKSIVYIENGKIIKTPDRELIEDVDSIPFSARDLVDDREFYGLAYSKAKPNTEMVVTRGCPFRCAFCANPVFRFKPRPLFRS